MGIPMRLRDLHRSSSGPIPDLIRLMQQQLQVAAGVPGGRLVILGVRGEYMNLNMQQLELFAQNATRFAALLEGVQDPYAASSGVIEAYDCRQGVDNWEKGWSRSKKAWCCKEEELACPEETVIDIEVLPGSAASDPVPAKVLATIARQMADPQSTLRLGPLSSVLEAATLTSQGAVVDPEAVEKPMKPLRSAGLRLTPSCSGFAGLWLVVLTGTQALS